MKGNRPQLRVHSVALIVSIASLLLTAPAFAGHAGRLAGVEECVNCHTLDANEMEPGTSYISAASRTLPTMKSLSDGKAPEVFGCTYCHSNDLNKEKMRGVLSHFGSQPSRHPVGYDFRNKTETKGEFLSSTATAFPDEMDCVDCHDPVLLVDQDPDNLDSPAPYANHADPAGSERKDNPAMLRNPSPEEFCRSCHGRKETYGKADVVVRSHSDIMLTEADGTPLKTSACRDCHNSHFSSKFKLFSDGREGNAPIEMGDDTHCSTICHERGDEEGSYDLRGHGKKVSSKGKPLNFGCGSCHSVNPRHEGTTPKMLNFQEDETLSAYEKSATSICYICHRRHGRHGAAGEEAGCLDCHDEHAEGTASNVYMIPRELPNNSDDATETFYEKSGVDFFRAEGDGLCDNAACHSRLASSKGTPLLPLKSFMEAGTHPGGAKAPGTDCLPCHRHDDKAGSWLGK